ncbi:MAG: DUF5630 domain-containing protein [Legionellales bacterium]|nr:DUF5630 domain-containing protein [Legionellales bacterium]
MFSNTDITQLTGYHFVIAVCIKHLRENAIGSLLSDLSKTQLLLTCLADEFLETWKTFLKQTRILGKKDYVFKLCETIHPFFQLAGIHFYNQGIIARKTQKKKDNEIKPSKAERENLAISASFGCFQAFKRLAKYYAIDIQNNRDDIDAILINFDTLAVINNQVHSTPALLISAQFYWIVASNYSKNNQAELAKQYYLIALKNLLLAKHYDSDCSIQKENAYFGETEISKAFISQDATLLPLSFSSWESALKQFMEYVSLAEIERKVLESNLFHASSNSNTSITLPQKTCSLK